MSQEQIDSPETTDTQVSETKPPRRRRFSGLIAFGFFATIALAVTYRSPVETIYCTTETLSPEPDVIMLGASWCPYCYKARKYFIDNKIDYCEYDIEDDGKGAQMYSQINNRSNIPGLQPAGIPILLIGDYQFSGFEESRIKKALATIKPL